MQLGIALFLIVLFHALEESLVATGLAEVLKPYVETLVQLPVADHLRHLDADGIPVHVEDHAGAAVVETIWHALGLVLLGELVARAMAITPGFCTRIPHVDAR